MLKALQPCSVLFVWKTLFWHQCVNIMVLRCSISPFDPSQSFIPSSHVSAAILLFNSPLFWFFFSHPSPLSSLLYFLFLPSWVQFLLYFLFIFSPWSSLASGWRWGWWWWWRGLLLLCPKHWYSAFTHWHCPDAWRLLLPWLRLMEKLHRLLFGTIVFTHTYLGRCCHSERLAAGEAEAGGGVGNYRQGTGMHSHLTVKHPQNRT